MSHHVLFGFKVFLAIFVSIALAIAFFYVGFTVGYANGVSNGWLAAKKVVEESGIFPDFGEEEMETTNISGEVDSIEGNTIIMKAENLTLNPLDPATPAERAITVNEDTVFVKRTEKPAEQFIAELDAYDAAIEAEAPGAIAIPLPYDEEVIQFEEIEPGDEIIAEAESNIRWEKSFTASKIVLQEQPLEE